MILSCPACSARFRIDADQLGVAGRKVRCAKCGHVWHATPDQDEEEPAPAADSGAAASGADDDASAETAAASAGEEDLPDEPPPFESFEAMREQMAGERRARSRARAREAVAQKPRRSWLRPLLGWLVLLAVVGGIAGGAWYARYSVVGTFPTAARLYDMAGISISTVAPGLRIQDVQPARQTQGDETLLVVTGRVVNDTDSTQPVPALRVTLKGADGTVLANLRVAAKSAAVPPGGSTAFEARQKNPPAGASEITVRFIRPGA